MSRGNAAVGTDGGEGGATGNTKSAANNKSRCMGQDGSANEPSRRLQTNHPGDEELSEMEGTESVVAPPPTKPLVFEMGMRDAME
jgi:hypothetical protein